MSSWQPRASGLWMDPGMAKTSRPASPASRAVISEPDSAAPLRRPACRGASPAMMRLRCGKWAAQRRRARRKFRDDGARSRRCGRPAPRCLARVHVVEPAAEHGDGDAAGGERAFVARGVDAEREPAGDGEPGAREAARRTRARCRARRRWDCGCRPSRAAAQPSTRDVARARTARPARRAIARSSARIVRRRWPAAARRPTRSSQRRSASTRASVGRGEPGDARGS